MLFGVAYWISKEYMSSQLQACARNIEKTMWLGELPLEKEGEMNPPHCITRCVWSIISGNGNYLPVFPALSVGDPGKVAKNMFTISPHKDGRWAINTGEQERFCVICLLEEDLNNEDWDLEFGRITSTWNALKSAAVSVFWTLSLICRTFLNFFPVATLIFDEVCKNLL